MRHLRRPRASRRPSDTGVRKVSRPSTWTSGIAPGAPDAEQDHPPRAVGRLDQVGVAGVLHGVVRAAVAEDRVVRAALEGPQRRDAAGDRDRVAGTGAALGDQQVPRPVDLCRGAAPRGTAGPSRTTAAAAAPEVGGGPESDNARPSYTGRRPTGTPGAGSPAGSTTTNGMLRAVRRAICSAGELGDDEDQAGGAPAGDGVDPGAARARPGPPGRRARRRGRSRARPPRRP